MYFTEIFCTTSSPAENTTLVSSAPYILDDKLEYQCLYNYSLVSGNLIRYCMADGKFNGSQPACASRSFLISAYTTFHNNRYRYYLARSFKTRVLVDLLPPCSIFYFQCQLRRVNCFNNFFAFQQMKFAH